MATAEGPHLVPDEVVPDEIVADDHDSSLGDDAALSTQSLSSSIFQYREENGRSYHAYRDGKYNLPNDEKENDRLDLQHELFIRTFNGKLGLAPPNKPNSNVKRVLDLGTGTGIWAIDYVDEHPNVEKVIGVDLSPIQPSFVAPNIEFLIDDIEEEWNYSTAFDYIHSRMMNSSVANWDRYASEAFHNLNPGGHVELQEIDVFVTSDDNTLTENHSLSKWVKLLDEASQKLGRPYFDPGKLKYVLTKAGFIDITVTKFKWPSNCWPRDKEYKELGLWNNSNFNIVLEAVSMAPFTRALGWTREEVTVFLATVRKELNDTNIHAYWNIVSVYGKKPSDSS